MVKRNVKYFIEKIPKDYRYLINIIGEDNGGFTPVRFINKECRCETVSTIKAIVSRRQLDFCKSCGNINKNKKNTFDWYSSKIPLKFRGNIIKLNSGNGYHELVRYTFSCGCCFDFKIGDLARRRQYITCKSCVAYNNCKLKMKPLDFYLKKLGSFSEGVRLLGEYRGIFSSIEYEYTCGCKIKTKLSNLISKKKLYYCVNCQHPVCKSEDEIIDALSKYLKDVRIVNGFPGNKTTIISSKCLNCCRVVKDTYFNLQQYYLRNKNQCKFCAPKSVVENELYEFVKSLNVKVLKSDFSTIKFSNSDSRFKELDIYCPENKFAIEYNGLYFHSEKYKSDRQYHWKKTKAAADLGITLLHIWEDKWNKSPDIYKSIIRAKLGVIGNKIYARNTYARQLSKNDLKLFLNENHIDGHVGCITGWGLFYKDKLVQCISVRKVNSQNKKYKGYLEIARSATAINTIVVGGESKLLSVVDNHAISNKYTGLLNYVDADFGGIHRERYGLFFEGNTGVSYFYTGEHDFFRVSRQRVQSKNGVSEKDIAKQSGLLRVNSNVNFIYIKKY